MIKARPCHSDPSICAVGRRRVLVSVAVAFLLAVPGAGQERTRINRLIEVLEQGEPAITTEVWTFIDQEHGPYVIDQLGERVATIAETRNDRG